MELVKSTVYIHFTLNGKNYIYMSIQLDIYAHTSIYATIHLPDKMYLYGHNKTTI